MQGLWITCALIAGALLEVLVGRYGVLLPLTAMIAFYFFVMRCWRQALWLSWITGTFVDMSYGRSFPYYLILLPLVLLCARAWKEYQLTHLYVAQVIPGAIIGGMAFFLALLASYMNLADGVSFPFFRYFMLALKCTGLVAFGLPLLVCLLETCSKLLGLRRFTRVGSERLLASVAEADEEGEDALR